MFENRKCLRAVIITKPEGQKVGRRKLSLLQYKQYEKSDTVAKNPNELVFEDVKSESTFSQPARFIIWVHPFDLYPVILTDLIVIIGY